MRSSSLRAAAGSHNCVVVFSSSSTHPVHSAHSLGVCEGILSAPKCRKNTGGDNLHRWGHKSSL